MDIGGTPFAYRELGPAAGVAPVLLNHITAVLDGDPAVVDGFAAERRVIVADLRRVGGSGGTTPDSTEAMAAHTAAFPGGSRGGHGRSARLLPGGMVAQALARQRPDLIPRMVPAGTASAGDEGPASRGTIRQSAFAKAAAEGKDPKHFLFFWRTLSGQAVADAFLARLDERTEDRDTPVPTRRSVPS